ncbi:MAG: hypothetical protein ACFB21_02685 [Opitutales bacterium]
MMGRELTKTHVLAALYFLGFSASISLHLPYQARVLFLFFGLYVMITVATQKGFHWAWGLLASLFSVVGLGVLLLVPRRHQNS